MPTLFRIVMSSCRYETLGQKGILELEIGTQFMEVIPIFEFGLQPTCPCLLGSSLYPAEWQRDPTSPKRKREREMKVRVKLGSYVTSHLPKLSLYHSWQKTQHKSNDLQGVPKSRFSWEMYYVKQIPLPHESPINSRGEWSCRGTGSKDDLVMIKRVDNLTLMLRQNHINLMRWLLSGHLLIKSKSHRRTMWARFVWISNLLCYLYVL